MVNKISVEAIKLTIDAKRLSKLKDENNHKLWVSFKIKTSFASTEIQNIESIETNT